MKRITLFQELFELLNEQTYNSQFWGFDSSMQLEILHQIGLGYLNLELTQEEL